MSTVQGEFQLSMDELLNGVAKLDIPDLEQLISELLTLRARRVAPSLSKEESRLLEKINQGLPPELQQRYDELTARRQAETMTSAEHQELLALIDRIERADVERVQALTELAQRRGISVVKLMAELGIRRSG
jgi:preprotein translocase subunit SecA